MKEIISNADLKFKNTLSKLHEKQSFIIAAGAHPSILKGIEIEYYETMTPLSQVATISAQDGTMLIVKPFDKETTKKIVDAVHKSSLGLNPVDEGEQIRIMVPALTDEKRKVFMKEAKELGEEFKISIRNIRTDTLKKIRSEDAPENETRQLEEELQNLVNENNKEIDEVIKVKINSLSHI